MGKGKKKTQQVLQKKQNTKPANPFEKKVNKQKFQILGRKVRGSEQNVIRSRENAFQNRQKTLLVEYQQRNKKNKFVDARIHDHQVDSISQEEQALIRFQKEVQKKFTKKKRNIYSLDDQDSHYGQFLGIRDDYVNSEEEDSDGEFNEEVEKTFQFDHFAQDSYNEESKREVPKSRKEVLQEIITKSKTHKRERAKLREENEEAQIQLDEEFDQIQSLLTKRSKDQEVPSRNERFQDFDLIVKELTFEPRGKPTDRLKTPEEIAKEEKERLEALEKERMSRMQESDGPIVGKIISGDDLVDDFVVEDTYQPDANHIQTVQSDEIEKTDTEESDDDSENSDRSESEEETTYLTHSDISEKSEREEKTPTAEIPYTIEAPDSYGEFAKMIEKRNIKEKALIFHRIRICNDISFGSQKKEKLRGFYLILLEHFEKLVEYDSISLTEINLTSKHLFEISQLIPAYTGQVFQQKLHSIFERMVKHSRKNNRLCWPKKKDIFLFRLIGNIFPVSDFHHPIITPTLLIMCRYIQECPIENGSDLTKGVFICNVLLHFLTPSKRFCPEVISFLTSLLVSVFGKPSLYTISEKLLSVSNPSKDFQRKSLQVHVTDTEISLTDDIKMNCLYIILNLLEKFSNLYTSLPSFAEIFSPVQTVLGNMKTVFGKSPLKDTIFHFYDHLTEHTVKIYRTRKPIQQEKKILSIRELKPKFHQPKIKEKDTVDEVKKWKRKIKEEKRGAIREIRRDNMFLAGEKEKEKREQIEERETKRREIQALLESEQHEIKEQQKSKNSLKRRSKF